MPPSETRLRITATMLLAMFLLSGCSKVISLGSNDAARLAKKINMDSLFATRLVLLAGVWELVSCAAVLKALWLEKLPSQRKNLIRWGCYSLALFTVLATLIFYAKPFKVYAFMSNMTTLCALLLLPEVCALTRI